MFLFDSSFVSLLWSKYTEGLELVLDGVKPNGIMNLEQNPKLWTYLAKNVPNPSPNLEKVSFDSRTISKTELQMNPKLVTMNWSVVPTLHFLNNYIFKWVSTESFILCIQFIHIPLFKLWVWVFWHFFTNFG